MGKKTDEAWRNVRAFAIGMGGMFLVLLVLRFLGVH